MRSLQGGGRPEKPDSDFACLRPFSRLGNAHAEGECSATLGKHRGGPRVLPGFGVKQSDFGGGDPAKTGLAFCTREAPFSPAKRSRPRRECVAALGTRRGGPAQFDRFRRHIA